MNEEDANHNSAVTSWHTLKILFYDYYSTGWLVCLFDLEIYSTADAQMPFGGIDGMFQYRDTITNTY